MASLWAQKGSHCAGLGEATPFEQSAPPKGKQAIGKLSAHSLVLQDEKKAIMFVVNCPAKGGNRYCSEGLKSE